MRDLFSVTRAAVGSAFCLLSSAKADSAETVLFIPATPKNTFLADGSPLPEPLESIGWQWQPDKDNHGMWESMIDRRKPPAVLMVSTPDLQSGATYEVFAYFWASDDASTQHHSIQLGLSLASMHPFGGERPDDLMQREPWVITPGYKTGEVFGLSAAVEEQDPLLEAGKLVTARDNERLIRARLGLSRASKDGTLPVFFAPNTGSRSPGVARMDGIAVRRAAADASPDQVRKPGTMLHLAIRAGDPVTIQRELDAGSDVNAFDEENLTPLFFAAASGDSGVVRKLLGHGADPELPAQSVSPLTAAAATAHTEIISILLEHGAKVPATPIRNKGALAIDIDPRRLHPVMAAIHAGSVPALESLLAANKELHLPDFEKAMIAMHAEPKSGLNSISLTGDAMHRMQWGMVAFLIEHGVSITCLNSGSSPEGVVLAYAVHAWPDSKPAVDAMLRRGEPVVTHLQSTSNDALNTAAFRGNADLVRRFLPQAGNAGTYYKNGLLENALSSGNREIIAMVRNRFPDAQAPRWTPRTNDGESPALEESAKRWFLPRTSPPPQARKNPVRGKHVLAVVAAPDAQGTGDLLAAHASQADAWQVVDRAHIEAALTESRIAKPWNDGEHRLSDLGDRLQADCLIVISTIRAGKESIHRFEVVETSTGMEIHREHIRSDAFVDPKEVAGFLERAAHALDIAGGNTYHQAVTLLSFSTQGPVGNPTAVTGLLRAAVQHEVDSTPGLISLSRAQSARLMEEKALGGKDSVWGAAHMVEGAISAHGEGKIKITLRLETIKSGDITAKSDAEAIGKSTEIAETARAAWKQLMSSSGNAITPTTGPPADRSRALSEGRRLMREVDWLHAIHAAPADYLPMIESALALGVPAQDTILLDLDARFRHFLFLFPKNSYALGGRDDKHTASLQHIFDILAYQRPSLEHSDQLVHHLSLAREFLHQTSWYLEHMGRNGLDGGTDLWQVYGSYQSNEIWHAIQALSIIRTLVYPDQIPDHLKPGFANFSNELDELTQRYFSLLKSLPEPDFYRYYLQIADFRMIQRNPALADGLVDMATTGASPALLLVLSDHYNRQFQWMTTIRELATKMVARIGDHPSSQLQFAKADLECFLAEPSQVPAAIRRLADAATRARWQTPPTRNQSGGFLASRSVLENGSISRLFDWQSHISSLEHNGSLIPSVLFSSRSAPDGTIRFSTYHKIFQIINQREAWGKPKTEANYDTFRASIGGYDPWELARLKSHKSKERPSNGPPSKSGKTLQGGPPGTMAKPAAKPLHSLIFGAGKKAQRQDKPSKPPTGQPKQPTQTPLRTALLADLRTTGAPGTVIWPLVDKADPNLLWFFHFPSDRDAIRVNQGGGDGALNWGPVYDKRILYTAPWLLCIDCRNGSLVHKINLHTAVGEAYGINIANRKCDVWRMALDQTKDRILTSVGWHDENYSGNKMGSVIIDKKSGKAHPVPRNPEIQEGEGDVSLDMWNRNNGVAAVGDHFFFLDAAGEWTGGAIKGIRSDDLAIFQVFPDLTVKPLTQMGRRPELTPFDAQNRAPISITPHGDRLMVIHPSTIAEYDPVANVWTITASLPTEKPTNKHTNAVADAQYWEHLRALNEVRMNGESTGWIAVSLAMKPGVLTFASRDKGWRTLPIESIIPDDFLEKTDAIEEHKTRDGSGRGGEKKTRMKDHPRFKKTIPVVLAQTDTDLILGEQTSDNYEWKHPSRNSHHLPFLWKVPKTEIMERLQPSKPREQ